MHRETHEHDWLGPELQRGLREVAAPAELWNRVRNARPESAPRARPVTNNRKLVWAMAAAVGMLAFGLSEIHRQSGAADEVFAMQALASDSQRIAYHCQNPSQLRAWVRAKTGLDLPLRSDASPSVQLIGAQMIEGTRGVEVAYRAGNRDAVLVVSHAGPNSSTVPHTHANGNVSSWVMDGERYTLACNDAADLQLACKLCHLD